MPNHVTNVITINGTPEEVETVLNAIQGANPDGTSLLFDFNTIEKMPEELENTTSPTNIVTQKEREVQLKELEEFKKNGGSFPPRVDLTKELQQQYTLDFGADNWYDWRREHWHTKWGAYDVSIQENRLTFDTAWSHPEIIIEKLSEKFPNIEFEVMYADEDIGSNFGEYTIKNNQTSNVLYLAAGSIEANQFACEVKGYDYKEYLEDMEECK